jgi:uncharacterized membrane protein YbhN (UPF0104 family)
MKKNIYFLSISLFAGFLFYFFHKNPDLLTQLESLTFNTLVLLFLLNTILLTLNGYFLKIITQPFGIVIKNHFWLSATTSMLNLITPFRGGAIFRGWYLNKKYHLDIKDVLVTIAGSYPITFFVNSFSGLCLLSYELYLGNTTAWWGWLFFGGILIGTFSLFFLPVIKYQKFDKLNLLIHGWHKITTRTTVLSEAAIIQLLFCLISASIIYTIAQSIGLEVTVSKSLIIACLMVFSIVINFTPGGIGITESFYIFAGLLVGVSIELIVLLSIINRAVGTVTLLFWGTIGKLFLLKT